MVITGFGDDPNPPGWTCWGLRLRSWPKPRFRPGVGVGDSKSLSSSQAAELERRFNRSVWGCLGEVGPGGSLGDLRFFC